MMPACWMRRAPSVPGMYQLGHVVAREEGHAHARRSRSSSAGTPSSAEGVGTPSGARGLRRCRDAIAARGGARPGSSSAMSAFWCCAASLALTERLGGAVEVEEEALISLSRSPPADRSHWLPCSRAMLRRSAQSAPASQCPSPLRHGEAVLHLLRLAWPAAAQAGAQRGLAQTRRTTLLVLSSLPCTKQLDVSAAVAPSAERGGRCTLLSAVAPGARSTRRTQSLGEPLYNDRRWL